nr:putative uncharacterized protein DDB_G0277255 isoform X2 [Penaeus vannamei]
MPSGEVMGVKQQPTSTGVGGLEEDKKAVYKNDDEYDEDLAQLDMLLHYVNNLSASLEFLAWENKRISTDLVPTLLNMYDALYARLSEGADATTTSGKSCDEGGGGRGAGGGGGGGGTGGEKMGFSNGSLDLSKIGQEERASTKENGNSGATENGLNSFKESGVCDQRLFIEEKDVENENQVNNNCVKCDKCGVLRTSKDGCRCSAKCVIAESITSMFETIENDLASPDSFYENVDKRRPRREHIYAEPQFLIKPKDSPKSTTSSSSTNTCSSSASSSTLTSTTSTTSSSSDKLPGTPASPPMGFDPRKLKDVYRPLSSISSSSSSSSNSLPRGPPGAATSYLASAESLEDNDADHSDTEETTRRRDRTIKTRREKAQRTGCLLLPHDLDFSSQFPGSGDSGVQCHSISLPAPPTLRPRYCDPNLAYMDRIVLEIVETEAIYVRDLKEIIEM